jgi:trk system potassium uptake protein
VHVEEQVVADRSRGEGQLVVVLGLGRFGGAVAAELVQQGFEVLGVDQDEERVRSHARALTHVVEADFTEVEALRQLGVADMSHGVVAVGSDIESSILATAALEDLGVPDIWAKAVSGPHGRILQRVGAHHVVHPEHDMGHRVAHLLGGRILEWLQLDEDFALVEAVAPTTLVGRTLGDAHVRDRYAVTVVCVKPRGGTFTYATPDTVPNEGDVLVVAGTTAAVEAFARLA